MNTHIHGGDKEIYRCVHLRTIINLSNRIAYYYNNGKHYLFRRPIQLIDPNPTTFTDNQPFDCTTLVWKLWLRIELRLFEAKAFLTQYVQLLPSLVWTEHRSYHLSDTYATCATCYASDAGYVSTLMLLLINLAYMNFNF